VWSGSTEKIWARCELSSVVTEGSRLPHIKQTKPNQTKPNQTKPNFPPHRLQWSRASAARVLIIVTRVVWCKGEFVTQKEQKPKPLDPLHVRVAALSVDCFSASLGDAWRHVAIYGISPAAVGLRPDVTCARHGADGVVVTAGTSAERPQRAPAAEQRLELLLTDLVPPARALPTHEASNSLSECGGNVKLEGSTTCWRCLLCWFYCFVEIFKTTDTFCSERTACVLVFDFDLLPVTSHNGQRRLEKLVVAWLAKRSPAFSWNPKLITVRHWTLSSPTLDPLQSTTGPYPVRHWTLSSPTLDPVQSDPVSLIVCTLILSFI
jgi:hypothetical protein